MIIVELPRDRTRVGRLKVQVNNAPPVFGPVTALGLADSAGAIEHNNPSRDPVHLFGDTPTGDYDIVVQQTPALPERSYGPYGVVRMDPTSGQALQAEQNGRSGLWIHGGDLSGAGLLRPTHGCVRLKNDDMKNLMAVLAANPQIDTCSIREVTGIHANSLVESFIFTADTSPLSEGEYVIDSTAPALMSARVMAAAPASPIVYTIDTDLKTTTSRLTAQSIKAFFESQPETHRALKDIGAAVIAVSTASQVNAAYIVAHAIWETGWGRSDIYKLKHNLFGWAAYDASPFPSARPFDDDADCINKVVPLINKHYLLSDGIYYSHAPCLGNKTYGMNKHYASDPNWGKGIARLATQIERSAG